MQVAENLFPRSYFENEVRDGFYVSTMMKRNWGAQMSILDVVDRICRKYDIRYFGAYGTMLGAVRHRGYIPWDDDIDLFMLRDDFEKFRLVLAKEIPDSYDYADERKSEGTFTGHMVICSYAREGVSKESLSRSYGFYFSAGIDIFPLDYLPRGEERQTEYRNLIGLIYTLLKHYEILSPEEQKEVIEGLKNNYNVQFNETESIMAQLSKLAEAIRSMWTAEDSDEVIALNAWMHNPKVKYRKELFEDTVYLPFEMTMMPEPVGYDEMLRVLFGDYMKPVRAGSLHDYPYYDKHVKHLNDEGIRHLYYHYNPEEARMIHDSRPDRKSVEARDACKMLFVVSTPAKWEYIRALYEEALGNADVRADVVVAPYFELDGMEKFGYSTLGSPIDVSKVFADELGIEIADSYDLSEEKPDIIITTEGYDGWNTARDIPDIWKIRNVVKNCNHLVYVQPFVTDDFDEADFAANRMAEDYAYIPGVMLADEVMVNSDAQKQAIIRAVSRKTNDDIATSITDKITVLDSYPIAKADATKWINNILKSY